MAAIVLGLPSAAILIWMDRVSRTVTEPYLDEVFHVRQAQHYCAGHFNVWDSKITTPPGLYLLSTAFGPVLGCDLWALRLLNMSALVILALFVHFVLRRQSRLWRGTELDMQFLGVHSALNVCLFPPLFFFSALYYTDVCSTLSVLVFHWRFILNFSSDAPAWRRNIELVVLGLASLTFRQTNIFWVGVFPATVVLVRELDRGHNVVKQSMYRGAQGFGDTWASIAKTAWRHDVVYDPPVRDASLEDYTKTVLTAVVCALKTATQPKRLVNLLAALVPYLVIIISFATFVLWNGGVVLGDKSNHVATLHLPQMLYLWPYITFFSWPLVYPYLLTPLMAMLSHVPVSGRMEPLLLFRRRSKLPRWWVSVGMAVIACMLVHFNTIVHPFTRADNRHYTFYVFRLLLRHPAIKYSVTPVYILCGWACIQALGAPIAKPSTSKTDAAEKNSKPSSAAQSTPLPLPDGIHTATTSFVLIWLATTALQLVTAPLVEPRYFILPWIFWRLHVPIQAPPLENKSQKKAKNPFLPEAKSLLWDDHDHQLWLETAWFLTVNAATGWIFINRPFEWKQEPGEAQRFMW